MAHRDHRADLTLGQGGLPEERKKGCATGGVTQPNHREDQMNNNEIAVF
jgi:hypothetical protein